MIAASTPSDGPLSKAIGGHRLRSSLTGPLGRDIDVSRAQKRNIQTPDRPPQRQALARIHFMSSLLERQRASPSDGPFCMAIEGAPVEKLLQWTLGQGRCCIQGPEAEDSNSRSTASAASNCKDSCHVFVIGEAASIPSDRPLSKTIGGSPAEKHP